MMTWCCLFISLSWKDKETNVYITVTAKIHYQLLDKNLQYNHADTKNKITGISHLYNKDKTLLLSKITTKMILVIASNAHMISGESKINMKIACSWCDQKRY